ncbi:MAG: DUF3240 family protein [Methylomonas sp.]|nr:DUF3240 family protein [Methylomonas sp.]PPD19513.1 MAG: hypothetical protein CTY23_11660 [Methylomonas sp.]PPD24319.1 MAG: hypothetical protein CTY22_11230 [Methylomonas sp.]PPD32876.1 MAG: hypothetical protein CTY21_11155 [Methylomonas sp.]PPD38386.1 MAG: hypothetical protein CTY17_09470 [Methylomonas sp.]
MTHTICLITLNVPVTLEEAMVDCLLAFENAQGFSSFIINAHDRHHQGWSREEQVTGRQRKLCFQLYVDRDSVSALLERIKIEFVGTGIHYWLVPVLEHGEL